MRIPPVSCRPTGNSQHRYMKRQVTQLYRTCGEVGLCLQYVSLPRSCPADARAKPSRHRARVQADGSQRFPAVALLASKPLRCSRLRVWQPLKLGSCVTEARERLQIGARKPWRKRMPRKPSSAHGQRQDCGLTTSAADRQLSCKSWTPVGLSLVRAAHGCGGCSDRNDRAQSGRRHHRRAMSRICCRHSSILPVPSG